MINTDTTIKTNRTLNAFSLTEVLVTMFIIMLLIIASAPMITKKNAKNKSPHGAWECKLDANGKHVSQTFIDGVSQGEKTETDHCVFEPQKNAKNYTVMLIGGGGGGASGTAFSLDKASFGLMQKYTVPADGEYQVLVIGGGGGGSAYLGNSGAMGGGAGGIVTRNISLSKGDQVSLEAGQGGERGGSANDETAGNEEDSCDGPPGTGWKDICLGGEGESSRLYVYNSNTTIEAPGGKGGTQFQPGQNGTPGHSAYATMAQSFAGRTIDFGDNSLKDYMNTNYKEGVTFGYGGKGIKSELAEKGRPGVVMLISKEHHSGGGGKRGYSAFMTLEKITDKVNVYVGQGGAGATTEDTNGEQGQNSSFGYYITAKGGEGGKTRYESTSSNNGLPGQEGGISPYGGTLAGGGSSVNNLDGTNKMSENDGIKAASETQYGAGGGGGGSVARTGTNQTSDGRWGMGGRGMPGYVRVEWN